MPRTTDFTRVVALLCLAAVARSAVAQTPTLPAGFAEAISYATPLDDDANKAQPSSCGSIFFSSGQTGVTSASAARTCHFVGDLQSTSAGFSPFNVGDVTTVGTSSFIQGGDLRADASLSGTLAANSAIRLNDAYAAYTDAITVTGDFVPASVVFTLAIHGTYTNDSGIFNGFGPFQDPSSGNLESISASLMLQALSFDPDGNFDGATNITPPIGLLAFGDGTTETGTFTIPWADYALGNTVGYQLTLAAYARALNNTGSDNDVFIDANYSNTASITSVAVFDANGDNITQLDHVTFASGPLVTPTPEPASVTLMAMGLAGVAVVVRRRRRIDC